MLEGNLFATARTKCRSQFLLGSGRDDLAWYSDGDVSLPKVRDSIVLIGKNAGRV